MALQTHSQNVSLAVRQSCFPALKVLPVAVFSPAFFAIKQAACLSLIPVGLLIQK